MTAQIPKVIHYCWFGGNKKSELIQKCITSWRQYCPDYKILEWNESNFDIHCCKYVEQAYAQKKWAFVSDYARFWLLNNYGGIYVDTDVQFLKPLDDLLFSKFIGFGVGNVVKTGLIMATFPDDWFCKEVLNTYKDIDFIWDDPTKIEAIGRRTAKILKRNGLVCDGKKQMVKDYIVYPQYYFDSTGGDMHSKPDERAYTIHHYMATWFPTNARIKNTIKRFLGIKLTNKIKGVLKSVNKNL